MKLSPRRLVRCPKPQDCVWGMICLLGWATGMAQPISETVELRNGDRITGRVVAEQTNAVTLLTTFHNIVVIPGEDIKTRRPASAPSPPPPPPATPAPPPIAPPAQSLVLVPPDVLPRWTGEAQVGTDLLFGEKTRKLVSGRLRLTYTHERLRTLGDYTFAYGHTDGVLSDHRMYGSIKTDYDLTRRFYAYGLGGAGYDEVRRIDARFELGPGAGWRAIKRDDWKLNFEVGGHYQREYLADDPDEEIYGARLAEDAAWQIHHRLSFDERFEYFVDARHLGHSRLRAEANVRYALISPISLVVTLTDEYDTITAPGVKRNDLQVRSSLSVTF